MTMTCPKCGHQRNANDDSEIPEGQCPACGIYYFKYINQKSIVYFGKRKYPSTRVHRKKQTLRI